MEEQPKWQKRLLSLWIVAVAFMATQYGVTKYDNHLVVIAPVGTLTVEAAEGQDPGNVFVEQLQTAGPVVAITPEVYNRVAHKLHQAPLAGFCDLLVALLFLIWLLLALLNRRRIQWHWPPLCLWAWVGAAAISGLNAGFNFKWATEVVQLFFLFIASFLLAVNLLTTEKALRQVATWLTLFTVGVIALGLVDYWFHIYAAPSPEENPELVRATFCSRTILGGFLALLLPLLFGFLLHARGVRKVGWLLLILIGLVPITSLGSLLGIGLAALLMSLWTAPSLKVLLPRLLLIVAVAVGFLPFALAERHMTYLFQSVTPFDPQTPPMSKRYLEWLATAHLLEDDAWIDRWQSRLEEVSDTVSEAELEQLAAAPKRLSLPHALLGVGAGENYQRNIGMYYRAALPNPEKMEPDTYNLYLLIAGQMGLVGLFALLYVLFDFLGRAYRTWQHGTGYLAALSFGLWGSLLALLVHSFFGTVLARGTGLVLVLVLAMIAAAERLVKPPAPEPAAQPSPQPQPAPKLESPDELLEESLRELEADSIPQLPESGKKAETSADGIESAINRALDVLDQDSPAEETRKEKKE